MRLFTIGHSNRPTEELVERLRKNGIAVVVDVRSKPFSRYNPQFNRYVIAEDLREAGIPYVWMGHSLGGVPEDPELMTLGKPDYEKIRASQSYQEGLEELVRGLEMNAALGAVALMCSEADPTGCHRRRLVGADLVSRGVELAHVLKDGTVVSEHEVREGVGENQPSALDLFS
jgi:uncharacterized protein (DUF488 family)